ncbi:MAG TPA: serine/threonine-protein kinase, partial [bacterium]|nr:serine/threonine-protein kinase [bacterium]
AEDDDTVLASGGGLAGGLAIGADAPDDAPPPDSIPGYRLLRPIGSGGMGHVWLAEQLEPVRRTVAIKIIQAGMDTGKVVARFESERQTLALMNHPGIAQIYDAGVTDAGRPFFSMELVDGPPVTEFADQARLTLEDRLALLVDVCEAIQHAHQKGVIHRDLKPSNVLVAVVDGRPAPKVIDFGIARLMEEPDPEAAPLTEAGTLIGTPEYMSPERSGAGPDDVDTRSDVYSLGVLLYELLTGSLPFRRRDSTPAALAELFRDVREGDLQLPSRYVAGLDESGDAAARARKLERFALVRSLRDDLDWITARSLEKSPERRYASVGELAEDIRRHLRHEPVMAGPPGAGYRVGKFVRRHRGLIASTTALVLALLAGLAGTMTGLVRARTEAAIAEAVNSFLNEDLLAAVSPESQGRDVSMRQVLDTAAERLQGRFPEQPVVEASLRATIGNTYASLGLLDEASPHLERAIALREAELGEDDPATLDAVHELGELRFYQGRRMEARELIGRAFEGRSRSLGPADARTLAALSDLGAVAQYEGNLEEAERHYREAYERASAALGDDSPYTLSMLHNLGALSKDLARLDEAEDYLRRALDGSRRQLGDEHPETLSTLSLLGTVLRDQDRLDEAEEIHVQLLATRHEVLGPDHPSTLLSANNLAMLYLDLGRLREAEELERATLETQRRVLGDDHDDSILSMGNLAAILLRQGRAAEAEPLTREARGRCERTLGADHTLCADTARKQGECLTALQRYAEAERALLRAHGTLADAYGTRHPDATHAAASLAALYEAWGRPADAARWREAVE